MIITGLYVFDKKVCSYAKKLKPSKRKELEIVDIINIYRKKNNLKLIKLGRGTAWLDVGSYEDLMSASDYVKNIEDRQSYKIGCLEEIALNNNWVTKKDIMKRILKYKNSKYSNYLKELIKL